ncbi:MAG: hypothetical protein AAF755_07045 [Pseudomonadota bacterium]
MSLSSLILLILCVIVAAGITIWLLSMNNAGVLVAALPALLIAAIAFRTLTK